MTPVVVEFGRNAVKGGNDSEHPPPDLNIHHLSGFAAALVMAGRGRSRSERLSHRCFRYPKMLEDVAAEG